MKLPILSYKNPLLSKPAVPVQEITAEIIFLAENMLDTMIAKGGVGLAAPQVGKLLAVFVMDIGWATGAPSPYVFINPEIVDRSGIQLLEEGCLSIPRVREKIPRAEKVTIKAQDVNGDWFTLSLDGLAAVCAQHEMDHLRGVLFINYLSRLRRNLAVQKAKQ